MDSLLKSTRMMCSVLRLEQSEEAVRLTAEIKQRRDICFSQALTSLVSSLVTRLWCHPPDPVFISILSTIGPLVCFEGLLSMHGEDVTIYNDMMVAVEDLRAVEFTLVLVENMKQSHQQSQSSIVESVSNFPLPRVTGSRAQLKVLLPVPAWVLQFRDSQATSFSITPVFFNFRMRMYIGFVLSECSCIAFGLGAYPTSSEPRPGSGPSKFEKLKEV